MAEEILSESAQPDGGKSAPTETNQEIVVNRSPEEYAKRVQELAAENKRRKESERALKAQLDDISKKLQEKETKEVEEQGKWKDAYEKIKAELESTKTQAKQKESTFAFKTVSGQFAAEAAKAGCLNPTALTKLATAEGLLNDLEISDEFEVSQESLKAAIEKAQKEHHYLFGKTTPAVRDGVPGGKTKSALASTDLTKMSVDELKALAKRLN